MAAWSRTIVAKVKDTVANTPVAHKQKNFN